MSPEALLEKAESLLSSDDGLTEEEYHNLYEECQAAGCDMTLFRYVEATDGCFYLKSDGG